MKHLSFVWMMAAFLGVTSHFALKGESKVSSGASRLATQLLFDTDMLQTLYFYTEFNVDNM